MKNFADSKSKFGYIYVMTPRGVAERAALTRQFLKRKLEEYERLQREIRELEGELDDAKRS
jgi:molybdenum-dependent DNA-binding transcriptional regulator ModE